ncbi:MAG TPA: MraY family glycosyltransferase [Anaerolineae bacterium]|nr:MraY family glycosyltransferase [Anaerolineae bacterium]
MTPFLLTFLIAFVLALVLTPLARPLGLRLGMVDRPGGRRQHGGIVSRLGALPLFVAFSVAALASRALGVPSLDPQEPIRVAGLLIGGAFVCVYGLIDDRFDLKPGWQFVAQLAAALIAIAALIIIERFNSPLSNQPANQPVILQPWQYIPLTLFWMMGMMNTVNWLDGLDGLAIGVAAIFSAIVFVAMIRVTPDQPQPQLSIALLPLALLGATLGFLPFNTYPARVFLGSGALFLGYVLASLGIIGGAKVATVLLILAVPILDVAWLIISRLRRGQSPTRGGRDHLHFRLLDLGLSQRTIVSLYYAVCALFGTLSLVIEGRLIKLITMGLLGSVILALLALLSRKAVNNGE